jgi:hypothetical protein
LQTADFYFSPEEARPEMATFLEVASAGQEESQCSGGITTPGNACCSICVEGALTGLINGYCLICGGNPLVLRQHLDGAGLSIHFETIFLIEVFGIERARQAADVVVDMACLFFGQQKAIAFSWSMSVPPVTAISSFRKGHIDGASAAAMRQ